MHYIEKGKPYILEDRLLEYEECRRILSEVSGNGMKILLEATLDPLDGTTMVSMHWKGTSNSIFIRIMLWFMRKKIAKQALNELLHFKSLVEVHGEVFSQ